VSPSFRKLGVPRDALDDDQLVAMMLEQPRLIRRPLIGVDGDLLRPLSGSDRIIQTLKDRLQAQ
jgi:arsenate reductase-like glutaredoxin family protein